MKNDLTVPEIEEIVCFFQDYYNDDTINDDSKYSPSITLKKAIDKLKDELR